MIKQLISDIAFDVIKLSQALTRAKIVESKIKNATFKRWISRELEGYDYQDESLPKYRKIWSVVNLTVEFEFGRTEDFPVILNDKFGEKIIDAMNFHRVIEPIPLIEQIVENLKQGDGYINISPQQVNMLASLYQEQVSAQGGWIKGGKREVAKGQYQNVLEQTKQKLLDTLMELESEFPNLIDDYNTTQENIEKVQNIITNHIYGNHNPMNIAAGINVEQNLFTKGLNDEDEKKLKSFGISAEEIEELRKIVEANSEDKPSFIAKSMKWLGGVTASVAGRGLYEHIPAITDFIHKLIM